MVSARVLAAWLRETDRPPLPAGDATSWAVLTDGTLLAATPWPSPWAGPGTANPVAAGRR